MLKKLKFLLVLAAVFAVAGCKAEVTEEEEVTAETPKYTITYDAAGHGTAPDAKTVEEGYKLTEEDLPALTADGFDFGGWKFNEKIVAAGEEVVSDMSLTAAWTEWGTVAAPTFSVAAGEVDKGTKVKITCTTEGAEIYYTTDESAPTAASTKYESEIEITAATTIKAFAVKSGMKDSTVAEVTYTVDVTPPANVTNFTAKCTASQTVKLTWTNPADADFAKVVITYDTNKTKEVKVTENPNNEATIEGLTDGTEYTFTVKAYDTAENESSGVDVNKTPFTGIYSTGKNGGLEGNSFDIQGETVKENWMADSGNLKINGTEIAKTSEVIAVPKGTVAKINMTSSDAKGDLFTSSRKVKLSPFVMSKYPVTRGLFKAVMGDYYNNIKNNQAGTTGIEDENPINYVNWFDAIVFCNKLSMKCGLDPVYSYDFSTDGTGKMTKPDDWFANTNLSATVPTDESDTNYSNWKDKVVIDLTANGYRLPTEAEWEFCARGGDPNAEDWGYTYSGSDTATEVAWCAENSNWSGTNIVGGMKKANRLGLYDMSGNVYEWCDDYYNSSATADDSKYTDSEGYVKDPLVVSVSDYRSECGGCGYERSYEFQIGYRARYFPYCRNDEYYYGIRLVRSIGRESN